MAYTLTQARPLLTAAELELFDQSRAEPIKGLTPARLAGKVKRARTLREKYRDLYRRQTVAARGESAATRPAKSTDNERTQRKADIFQEVLERFEARTTLLQGRSERDAARAPRATKPAAAGKKTASSVRAKTDSSAAKTAEPAAKKTARSLGGTAAAPTAADAEASTGAPVSASRKKPGAAPARSDKAPSRKAPTSGSKAQAPQVNAPLDTVASAERASPLKQKPGNIAIHAHQSSSARRTQGKRDSR